MLRVDVGSEPVAQRILEQRQDCLLEHYTDYQSKYIQQ